MSEAEKNTSHDARAITISAFFSILLFSLVVSLPGILINEIVETFSLDGADEGLMGTMLSLGFMVSLFVVLSIQGRAQKITVLILASAAQAAMLLFIGLSPTFFLFCIACALLGFSGGFIDTFSNSSIVDARKDKSTKYLGILHGLFGIGCLSSPLIYILVQRYIDWRGAHIALAIASILVMLLMCLLSRGLGKTSGKKAEREHLFSKKDLLSFFRVRRNVALAFAGFFSMLTISCIMVWIVRYMTLQHNAADLGVLSVSVYWACSTINRFFLAHITRRAPLLFFSLGALLSAACILIGVFSGSPVVLCFMLGVFGLCSGHFVPVLVTQCAKGYEGRTTFTTSIVMFIMCSGRIVAPVTIAFVSTQISLTLGMMLPVAAALAGAIFGWLALVAGKNLEKNPKTLP